MKIVFLDTETTGIPSSLNINTDDQVRIVQMGWIITDNSTITHTRTFIIKPEGYTITNDFVHGITTEKATKEGQSIDKIIKLFLEDIQGVDQIVCHNVTFDMYMLVFEVRKLGINTDYLTSIPTFCTMRSSSIKGVRYQRLKDLYFSFFNETPAILHEAMEDTYSCLRCYFYMQHKIDMADEIAKSKSK